jgi:hypothetical protein
MALSNILETLIHAGKAEFKTFSAGGSQKSILNIQQNHYIIITNVLFQPQYKGDSLNQLNIVSEGKINSLIFRNMLNTGIATNYNSAISVDTYFMHKNSVQFCLSRCDKLNTGFDVGFFKNLSVGFYPVSDYGKADVIGSSNTLTKRAQNLGTLQTINFQGNTIKESNDYDGLNYPMTGLSFDGLPENIPLVTISYVEVFQNQNNER